MTVLTPVLITRSETVPASASSPIRAAADHLVDLGLSDPVEELRLAHEGSSYRPFDQTHLAVRIVA